MSSYSLKKKLTNGQKDHWFACLSSAMISRAHSEQDQRIMLTP